MTLEELNRRLAWFASHNLADDDRVWAALRAAWYEGYWAALKDARSEPSVAYKDKNPYRP